VPQLYLNVQPHVGFNIEIKYPDAHLTRKRLRTYEERNTFLDSVLQVCSVSLCLSLSLSLADTMAVQVTLECAGDRPIYFSTFDPDMVWLLRRKQARYPVFFLTEGTPISKRDDPRSHDLGAAVVFAADGASPCLIRVKFDPSDLCVQPG
jgi:glycerophosphodiester phosphodiesterase